MIKYKITASVIILCNNYVSLLAKFVKSEFSSCDDQERTHLLDAVFIQTYSDVKTFWQYDLSQEVIQMLNMVYAYTCCQICYVCLKNMKTLSACECTSA